MKTRVLDASIRQLPVGQGGFLVSEITGPCGSSFTYAFDCGSLNREHFEQGLSYCSPGRIDVLFISHLDADHINGIDALMAHMHVDTVILPCLDALHVTMIACEAIGPAGIRMSVQTFLADPTQWFAVRGVKRILHLQRGSNDETQPFNPVSEEEPGNGPLDRDEKQDQGIQYTIHSIGASVTDLEASKNIVVEALGEQTVLTIGHSKIPLWQLVPYVHPFPEDVIWSFHQAVGKMLPNIFTKRSICSKGFTKRLIEVLADEERRKALKRCYAILSSDNNKPSLSLYSGAHPGIRKNISIDRTDAQTFWRHSNSSPMLRWSGSRHTREGAGSWLSTGDANLQSSETRRPWLARYRNVLRDLDVLVLPHHGSNRSIHQEVLENSGDAILLVCAAIGRAKHPHPSLLSRLRLQKRVVWQVSENTDSAYALQVCISF